MFEYTIGSKKHGATSKYFRRAARAIIVKDNKVLVLKSDNKEVKLPGGGLEPNETYDIALKREIREETGYAVKDSTEVGTIWTFGQSKIDETKIFSMESKYFMVQTNEVPEKTNFQGYEVEENFRPVFIEIEEAIKINQLAYADDEKNDIAQRELLVFKEIKNFLTNTRKE